MASDESIGILCRHSESDSKVCLWPGMIGRANVSHAKLHGQGLRAFEYSGAAAAAAPVSIRAGAVCSRRDAVQVLFGRAASAADRSRAVTASA